MQNPGAAPYHPAGLQQELTNQDRETIVCLLLNASQNDQLPHGIVKATADNFNVTRQTISCIWKNVSLHEQTVTML